MTDRRVAVIVTGLGAGGAEHMLYKLVEAARNSSTRLMVVSLLDEGMFGDRIRAAGADVMCCHLNRRAGAGSLLGAIAALRAFRPTVIQGWMYHGNLVASLLRWLVPGRPKLFWSIRQTLYSIETEPPRLRKIIRLLAAMSGRVRAIIYNSSLSVRHHQAVGIRSQADLMIPNGFDLDRYRPDPERRKAMRYRLGIGEEPLVGLVARVHPMKDHAGFVAAGAQIARAIPGVRFVLAGEGTDTPEMQALLEAQGISGQTTCLGRMTHTEELYPALDVFVLSSAWGEGWPNVVGEAMASGVVAVGTDVGETGNVIGDTGLVVEASNPQALADACIQVLQMPAESRLMLGRRAHERIMSHFEIHAVFEQYARAWDEAPLN